MKRIQSEIIQSTPLLPETSGLGAVHLTVTNLERALSIWRDVVGLTVVHQDHNQIQLGVEKTVLVVLHVDAQAPVEQRHAGLYHLAIHVPERRHLAQFLMRTVKANVRAAPTDHLVTEAIYIWDHDGHGIEVTFETPWRGRLHFEGGDIFSVDVNGKPHTRPEGIDVEDLLTELNPGDDSTSRLPVGTRLGHVHLHVNDLDDSLHFYRDVIGFGGYLMMRGARMCDVGLGHMPHTVAFNTWSGTGAKPAPSGTAQMLWFTLEVPHLAELEKVKARLLANNVAFEEEELGLSTRDPSGNELKVIVQQM